jgi:hypothetical protein
VFADRRGKLIDHGAEHEQRRALGPHRVAAQTRHGDPAAQAQEAGAHRGAPAVTFVQRFGGALNLNVHFHCVIPDGVFVARAGSGPVR